MDSKTSIILTQMAEDAWEAVQFAEQAGTWEVFKEKSMYQKAIAMCLINIGSLIKQLPEDFKQQHGHIPWKHLSGMWDITAHGYHMMNKKVLWQMAKGGDIPVLLDFLCNTLR